MFVIEDKFGINREEKFTELGNKICLICTSFEPRSAVNSDEIIIDFKWSICAKAFEPYRNIEAPTLFDYKYQEIAGAKGVRSYTNADKRVDLEIVNGVPQPKMIQATDEFGNPAFLPQLDVNGEAITIPEIIPAVIVDEIEIEPERTIYHVQYTTDPVMVPVMIGNIDFWVKFGGASIIQDLQFTTSQISKSDISTFIKL